jgi:hypothetical protein
MQLVEGLPDEARPLHSELVQLVKDHRPTADSFFYNGGTAVSLLATGAATVLASTEPLLAAACSGLAAFVIAISRALNFGGRWRWHLERQNEYCRLIYRLNQVALLEPESQKSAVGALYDRMIAERALDAGIPGSGEPVTSAADTHPEVGKAGSRDRQATPSSSAVGQSGGGVEG